MDWKTDGGERAPVGLPFVRAVSPASQVRKPPVFRPRLAHLSGAHGILDVKLILNSVNTYLPSFLVVLRSSLTLEVNAVRAHLVHVLT